MCIYFAVMHLPNIFKFLLQALESFLLRCPRDISFYCVDILHLTLEYLSYDPNFTDNMEEDTDDEGHEEEEDEYVFWSTWLLYGIHTCMIFL